MTNEEFLDLYSIDLSDRVKFKKDLAYLPWARSWAELKKKDPNATFKVHENEFGRFWFDDGNTAWTKVSVTAFGLTYTEILPVMNFSNQSLAAEKVTSTEANKCMQRCLTKAIALHGIGLDVYEGEIDTPSSGSKSKRTQYVGKNLDEIPVSSELKKARQEITNLSKTLISSGVPRDQVIAAIQKNNNGKAQPNSIPTVEDCNRIADVLKKLKGE